MDQFMERAIELALKNVREGGDPFGAVLVKDGDIVAEGVNESHLHYDVSGHAELLAIKRAQQKLQTNDLSGYTMYASGEPCPMCLSAMYFTGITEVFYAQSIEDAAAVGLGTSKQIYEDLRLDNKDRLIVKKQMPLKNSQKNPMEEWSK